MIKAVIFDMDGLLIDSEPLWQRARLAAFGAERLRWTDADQLAVMGSSTQAWAAFLAERLEHAYTPDEVIDRVLVEMERLYFEHLPLLPGAREAIGGLRGRYPLGLATGSPNRLVRAALRSAGWTDVFDEIVSSDDVSNGKPSPEIYHTILRRMRLEPTEAVIFEDSANGILAGHAAGVKVIAVPSEYHRPPADVLDKAAVVLASLHDFSPALLATL